MGRIRGLVGCNAHRPIPWTPSGDQGSRVQHQGIHPPSPVWEAGRATNPHAHLWHGNPYHPPPETDLDTKKQKLRDETHTDLGLKDRSSGPQSSSPALSFKHTVGLNYFGSRADPFPNEILHFQNINQESRAAPLGTGSGEVVWGSKVSLALGFCLLGGEGGSSSSDRHL